MSPAMTYVPAPHESPSTVVHAPSSRLVSLDALRGFDMLWITGGGLLGAALRAFGSDSNAAPLALQLQHVKWEGFHFEDLIFPMFVFIAGVSLVFSLPKMVVKDGFGGAVRRIFSRTVILFALGIFVSGGFSRGFDDVRWLGVLQRIALAYCGASLLSLWLKPRGLIAATLVLLGGYWALLTFVPVPMFGAGDFNEGHNLTNYLDRMYLPGRRYDVDHDPEGLLSTLPAIASCLIGVLAGLWLKGEAKPGRKALVLAICGAVFVGLGWAWSPWFPVIKKLWTSSFVLVAAGWSAMLLAVFYWIIEIRGWRRWAEPFVWIGLNPIIIYVGGNMIEWPKIAARFTGGDLQKWLNFSAHPGAGDLLTAFVAMGFSFLLAWFLHRRKLYLRA
jgi:predicted acyltransferase